MRRAVVALAVVAAGAVGGATPAGAHATLQSTEPAAASALGRTPERVVLRFDEPVEVSFGAIRIYDRAGTRIETGPARHVGGRAEAVAVEPEALAQGAYVVTWRVLSADAHPVRGAFTFRIGPGAGGDADALARRLLAAEGGSTAVGALYAVDRLVAFAALVVLLGGAVFLGWLWPAGWDAPRVRRLVGAAWAAAVASTGVGLGLEGAYAGGLPLSDAVRPSVVSAVLDTRFGRAWAARLVLLVLGGVVLRALARGRRTHPGLGVVGGLMALAILATPGLAGHAATGDHVALALPADVVHLAAVSVWLGGLAVLAVGLLPGADPDALGRIVPRFSRVAFGAVTVIAATGLFQGWRQVGSLPALRTTTYGRLLIVKLALFAGLLTLAWLSRRWVQRRSWVAAPVLSPGPGAASAPLASARTAQLRRSVGAELAVAVGVLLVTALLVNAQPASSALAQPFSTELTAGAVLIDVTVDPAKAGPADIHAYTLSRSGQVRDVEDFQVRLRLPDRDIGPLTVPMRRAGPGHFAAYGFDIPLPGTWALDVAVRLDDFNQPQATTTVTVR